MDMFGFKCAKNTLMILNVFYIIVGVMLAAVGGHLITSNKVTSLPIIGGIVACGIFLIVISLIGIYGAARHHQVLLFFYMLVLFLIFFIQFIVACVCLGVSSERQLEIASYGWSVSSNHTKEDVQRTFECCGYEHYNNTDVAKGMDHPSCDKIDKCTHKTDGTICQPNTCCNGDGDGPDKPYCGCPYCKAEIGDIIGSAFSSAGVTSLLFSFTEIIGGVLAWRYRNLYTNGLVS